MPEIEIRPAVATDIPLLIAIEHNYSSEYVWQMELQVEESQVGINFREIRLPRSVHVEYPRSVSLLTEDWMRRDGILAAILQGEPVGYVSLSLGIAPLTAWITDLAVDRQARRQGIASALILAAQEWGSDQRNRRLVLEIQLKNFAAIHLAQKHGFDFCGYNDRYFANHDIALFFAKSLH
jgi:ribosomal protein S18 acetylase RimI-like enzyme